MGNYPGQDASKAWGNVKYTQVTRPKHQVVTMINCKSDSNWFNNDLKYFILIILKSDQFHTNYFHVN